MEKKKFLQENKQLEAQRNNLKSKLANPSLQDQQVLEQGKYVYHGNILIYFYFLFLLFIAIVYCMF